MYLIKNNLYICATKLISMNKQVKRKPIKARLIKGYNPRAKSVNFIRESVLVEQELMPYHEYESKWYSETTV